MGASKAKPQTKVVEREIVTPERQETTTTTTPGSVVREREEVPIEATQPKFQSTGHRLYDLILQKAQEARNP
jgi:hypothetical protein